MSQLLGGRLSDDRLLFGGCSRGLRLGRGGVACRYCPFLVPLAIAQICPPHTPQGQHKVVVVGAVIEGFGRTGGIRDAVMRKLGAQSDGSPLLVIQELVIGGRPITEKKFGWRNGSILLVS